MKNLVFTTAAFALVGCAAIEPNSVHIGAEHLSSISQHFGPGATDVGVEMAVLSAQWQPSRYTYLEVQDGYIFAGDTFAGKSQREVFQARAGLNIPVKP